MWSTVRLGIGAGFTTNVCAQLDWVIVATPDLDSIRLLFRSLFDNFILQLSCVSFSHLHSHNAAEKKRKRKRKSGGVLGLIQFATSSSSCTHVDPYRIRSRMDPRHTSPSFYDFKDHDYRHPNETSPRAMPDLPFSSHGPLPIPSRPAMHNAPPPLPPPTRIQDLENGYDAGWLHANSGRSTALPPINPNSSLFGGHRRPDSAPRSDPMAVDELEGRQSGFPLSRSPEAQIKIEPPPPTDDGFPNSMSVNSPSGPM